MKHISEAQAWKEYHARKGVPRPPVRSLQELSAELGVPMKTLAGKLKLKGAPKAKLSRRLGNGTKAQYDPDEFRKWWATMTEDKNVQKT